MIRVLLIGMLEDNALRKGFSGIVDTFIHCDTPEEARLKIGDVDLFILDSGFGIEACHNFLTWARKNTAALGIIEEDVLNNYICIEAINSGIICEYLIRPVTAEQYAVALVKFNEMLTEKEGSSIHDNIVPIP